MTDLITAIAVMTVVSFAAGMLSGFVFHSDKGQRTILCLSVAVLAAVYFLFYGSGQLFWAKVVPHSAAIVYTNFAGVLAGLAAGWAARLPETPRWRRFAASSMLGCMAFAAVLWPLLSMAVRPPPYGGDEWNGPVAMQTSWATCSPAAGATLLTAEGIPTNEAMMVPLCLSDSAGTPTLGLYRGIKIIADQNQRVVEVLDCSMDELLQQNDWPVLLAVGLPHGVEDRRYADQWGWIPGMGHSVVAMGRTAEGGVVIADPSVGMEVWTEDDLRLLWHGDGIRITP